MITPAKLHDLLTYEADTGKLFWKERPAEMFSSESYGLRWNKRYAGREAFIANTRGYQVGAIFDQMILAHRAIWALMTGAWPEAGIDHINGDRADNRWENLRAATQAQNMKNQRPRSGGASPFKGVKRVKSGRWCAQITLDYTTRHIGVYDDQESAARAYDAAATRLHGEFACLNFPINEGVAP